MNKRLILSIAILFSLSFLPSFLFGVSALSGGEIVLNSGILDLRGVPRLRTRENNEPGRFLTLSDLVEGDLFLSEGNKLLKVIEIYKQDGKTVIETVEPLPEEAFADLYIPEQEVGLNRDDVDPWSMAPGVRLLAPGERSPIEDQYDLGLKYEDKNSPEPSPDSRTLLWMDTDPEMNDRDKTEFEIDILLATAPAPLDIFGDNAAETAFGDKKEDADSGSSGGDSTTADGGSTTESNETPSVEPNSRKKIHKQASVSGEVRLVGVLRVTDPIVKTALKMPTMKITWVKVWWKIYVPKPEFKKGYARANVSIGEQFDFRLYGKVNLSEEVIIPIVGYGKSGSNISVAIGLYAKINLDGSITLGIDVSEYVRQSFGASLDLLWPFIPYKASGYGNETYYNFAYRPYIDMEAEVRAGVYAGVSAKVMGITLISGEAGGGLYFSANGYLSPTGIMGADSSIGQYGNFDHWLLNVDLELGAFLTAHFGVAFWDFTLLDKKWPFWTWSKEYDL